MPGNSWQGRERGELVHESYMERMGGFMLKSSICTLPSAGMPPRWRSVLHPCPVHEGHDGDVLGYPPGTSCCCWQSAAAWLPSFGSCAPT